ncbi:hypothetical protein ABZP36_009003 [Zizania latifolia]
MVGGCGASGVAMQELANWPSGAREGGEGAWAVAPHGGCQVAKAWSGQVRASGGGSGASGCSGQGRALRRSGSLDLAQVTCGSKSAELHHGSCCMRPVSLIICFSTLLHMLLPLVDDISCHHQGAGQHIGEGHLLAARSRDRHGRSASVLQLSVFRARLRHPPPPPCSLPI